MATAFPDYRLTNAAFAVNKIAPERQYEHGDAVRMPIEDFFDAVNKNKDRVKRLVDQLGPVFGYRSHVVAELDLIRESLASIPGTMTSKMCQLTIRSSTAQTMKAMERKQQTGVRGHGRSRSGCHVVGGHSRVHGKRLVWVGRHCRGDRHRRARHEKPRRGRDEKDKCRSRSSSSYYTISTDTDEAELQRRD